MVYIFRHFHAIVFFLSLIFSQVLDITPKVFLYGLCLGRFGQSNTSVFVLLPRIKIFTTWKISRLPYYWKWLQRSGFLYLREDLWELFDHLIHSLWFSNSNRIVIVHDWLLGWVQTGDKTWSPYLHFQLRQRLFLSDMGEGDSNFGMCCIIQTMLPE